MEGWLPLLPEVHLPRLTGQMLDVVQRKGATAGSLDVWGWRELKVLPVSWYDELARILTEVEDVGVWPDGLLDADIAMIPKTDGDATPLGQRPLVYRVSASARMSQLEDWFRHAYFEYHLHVRLRFKLAQGAQLVHCFATQKLRKRRRHLFCLVLCRSRQV